MSDLFFTGSARRTSGAFTVTMKNGDKLAKQLAKLEKGGETALQKTVNDFTSRAPAWVSKGIREHYGVDTAAIKDAATKPKRGRTSIRVAGIAVDGATLEYKGRTLTPTHFKMSPKTKNPKGLTTKKDNKIPGQAVNFKKGPPGQVAMSRAPNPYTVKATIIKGQRVSLGGGTFIAQSTKDGQQVPLPFQKTGEGRTPIEAVRTLSVPQMIDGRAHDTIEQTISEKLGERFQHHVAQAMK